MKPAVFLDRDGVLNEVVLKDGRPFPPNSLQELKIPVGTSEALWNLKKAGYVLICVTNQPDVKRGKSQQQNVAAINQALIQTLPLDDLLVCYHDDHDQCKCRKPKPGLLLEGAQRHEVELAASFMIGDRWRDVEAGKQAGCRSIWIDYGYLEKKPSIVPDYTAKTFSESVAWILKNYF